MSARPSPSTRRGSAPLRPGSGALQPAPSSPGPLNPKRGEIEARLAALDWPALEDSLWRYGYARTPALLTARECAALAALYGEERRFRSRIDMARYRFGEGEYGYFAHPLPPLVRRLRTHLYRSLAPIAGAMAAALGEEGSYPTTHSAYLEHCREAGQAKPTPLLLRYRAEGYNRLHQDLYGPLHFPLQAACALSRPGRDYGGGAFLLVENLPRQQSRGEAILPEQGEFVIFPVRHRPVRGKRGWLRAGVRHGVSRITHGERYTLGIIFHDAS